MSMLKKYEPDPPHVLNFETTEIDERITYVEKSVQILDRREQILETRPFHWSRYCGNIMRWKKLRETVKRI